MIVKIFGSSVIGIDAYLIDVEVDTSPGLPQFSTVGLPDVSVRESRDRIKAAIKNSGYPFPRHHVTVNLARRISKRKERVLTFPSPQVSWRRKVWSDRICFTTISSWENFL